MPAYTPIDLGVAGNADYAYALAINGSGQVAGGIGLENSDRHAMLWTNGRAADLGTLGGRLAAATSINDAGQVAGWSETASGGAGVLTAFLWQNGTMTDLGITLENAGVWSDPVPALNNAGVIVGPMTTPTGVHAFIWENGSVLDLASLLPAGSGWTNLSATDVNDFGQIVGHGILNGATRAFLYTDTDGDGLFATGPGQIVSLGTLGGNFSTATGINNNGQVCGGAATGQNETHGYLWKPSTPRGSSGTMKDLGRLSGTYSQMQSAWSGSFGLSDDGTVVGSSTSGNFLTHHAVISTGGTKFRDLNAQIPAGSGWVFGTAFAVSSSGRIVGSGSKDSTTSPFLLLPGSVTTPLLSVENVTISEGDSGTSPATFTVSLSSASTQVVTVDYATSEHGALGGADFVAAAGTLTFAPGQTTKTITILVNGDTVSEINEPFFVNLMNPVNALMSDARGYATILDDDAHLSISDATVTEGNSGTTPAVFTVSLSRASTRAITVDFATRDGGAKAGSDYVGVAGTVTFNPGEISKSITVLVIGDTIRESDEGFVVDLSNPVNVIYTDNRGDGVILNDEKSGGKPLSATSAAPGKARELICPEVAASLLGEASRRWQAAGVDTLALHGIDLRIADLGGMTLGEAADDTIWLDDDAAGWGWFVDATPGDDSEFTTPGNQGECNRMDLLTVLEHEVGHLLGYEHQESGVMIDTLPAGTRRLPGSDVNLADVANIDWISVADQLLPASQRRK